ncbi:MAG: hypothetical protein ACK5P4_11520 [Bacteroidota bacterium]|jgi:hypothetical protein
MKKINQNKKISSNPLALDSLIVDFFYQFRDKTRKHRGNSDWAKKDAQSFIEIFSNIYEYRSEEEAKTFLDQQLHTFPQPKNIKELNSRIENILGKPEKNDIPLTTPHKSCLQTIDIFLEAWPAEKRKEYLVFLYTKYGYKTKEDKNAILEIIVDMYINCHNTDMSILDIKELKELTRKAQYHKKKPWEHGTLGTDQIADLIATDLYTVFMEPSIYGVDAFCKLVFLKFNITGNSKIIIETAVELSKKNIAGNSYNEKMRNFKKLFKQNLSAKGLEGDNLRQALSRLKKKLEINKLDEPLRLMSFTIHSIQTNFQTLPNNISAYDEKRLKVMEVLFDRVDRYLAKSKD